MHAGRRYTLKEIAGWTRRETAVFVLLSAIPTALYSIAGWKAVAIPWVPIALIGTAVAFITGFKNSASYSRLWEARQIWGSIVNSSRAFGILVIDFTADETARRRLIYRHIAWLTALRYQLREPRTWENMTQRHNVEYQKRYRVAEWEGKLDQELPALLVDPADLPYVLARKNRALHLLDLQARDLRTLKPGGGGESAELRLIELQRQVTALIDAQGRSERIKNFPYPRQYATLNRFFIGLFILLVPFGLLQEFQKHGDVFVWMTVPASTAVAWVFHTMDKIGEGSENPFEGGPNDVPITAMSRGIEIDLREMLGETSIPSALQPVNNILM